jgi:hypothetical protein
MNDPHVEWLRYRIELGPAFRVTDPSPRNYEADDYTLQLEAGKLTDEEKVVAGIEYPGSGTCKLGEEPTRRK